jgi:hypothetical protein
MITKEKDSQCFCQENYASHKETNQAGSVRASCAHVVQFSGKGWRKEKNTSHCISAGQGHSTTGAKKKTLRDGELGMELRGESTCQVQVSAALPFITRLYSSICAILYWSKQFQAHPDRRAGKLYSNP